MNHTFANCVALGVLATSAIPVATQAQTVTSARQTWEYRIVKEDDYTANQQLADAGAQGWELVSVVCTTAEITSYSSGSVGGGGTNGCWYYFKRPK